MSHGISSDYAAGSAQPENPAASNTTSSGIGGGAGIPSRAAPDSTELTSSANPSLTSGTGTSHHAGASGISGGPASTTAGPHQSNVANKMDPRIDSDLDGRSGLTGSQHTAGSGLTGSLGSGTTGTHTSGLGNSRHATTTAGPHSSNIVNKADPRVDSDRDGRGIAQQAAGNVGNQHNSGLTGAHNTSGLNTGVGVGSTGLASTQTHGTTGLGGSHTAGPHSSNIANKADPRVDSDRDGRGIGQGVPGTTSTGTTHGAHTGSHVPGTSTTYGAAGLTGPHGSTGYGGSTTSGPHSSNIANKADPRVDSDRDGRGIGQGVPGTTSTGTTHGTHGSGSTNAGPHNSNIANKADPRVDSDLDGRARHGGNPATGTGGALDTATAHTTATANRDSSITSSSGPSFTKSSSMNPPQLPPISGTGSSGFSELTSAKTQGLVGGRKSDHLASSNTGHFTGTANSSGIVAPSSRDDGLAGRHSSVPGLGAGVSQQEAAQEAKRHEQMDMAELNTQGGGAQGIHSQGVAAQGAGTQGIGSQGVGSQGVGQGIGSQGVATQGVGHQGTASQGVQSQGVGAQGVGVQGVGAQGVNSMGLSAQTAAQGTGTQGHAQGQRVRSMVDEAEAALSPSKTRSGAGYQTQPGTGAL